MIARGRGKSRRSMKVVETSITILREIHPASIRAVCYRLFTLGVIDGMTKGETNRVGRHLLADLPAPHDNELGAGQFLQPHRTPRMNA